MSSQSKTIDMSEKFDRQYKLGEASALRELERAACGCDYGGASWTTKSEADDLSRLLQLWPGVNLLEIGAGSGWPVFVPDQRNRL